MKEQTAVEYLIDQLLPKALTAEQYYHIQQAKAMEKGQIIQAYYQNGWNDNDNEHNAEQYYNETFKQD